MQRGEIMYRWGSTLYSLNINFSRGGLFENKAVQLSVLHWFGCVIRSEKTGFQQFWVVWKTDFFFNAVGLF
jgi:hypothetical protein